MITLLTCLLFGFSFLNIHWATHRITWMASIVTSEMGYVFSLICLILSIWNYRRLNSKKFFVLNIISAFLFLFPLLMNLSYIPQWTQDFEKNFSVTPHFFSFSNLWTGLPYTTVEPETHIYSQKKNLKLLLYKGHCSTACPFVIVVHGGGWDSGDPSQLPELNSFLANHQMSVASVSYRLAPGEKWPAPKEDVIEALEFLKSNAKEFNLDSQNYILLGRSAGAQIAGVIAYTYADPALKGYVDFYGPTDMVFGYEVADEEDIINSRALIENYLQAPLMAHFENYQSASLIQNTSAHSVPTLILHGRNDPLCWYKHAERLKRRLDFYKIPSVSILFPYSTHGLDFFIRSSSGQISSQAVLSFAKSLF